MNGDKLEWATWSEIGECDSIGFDSLYAYTENILRNLSTAPAAAQRRRIDSASECAAETDPGLRYGQVREKHLQVQAHAGQLARSRAALLSAVA
eukprot:3597274-Pyramimonas_sp.AAC.1